MWESQGGYAGYARYKVCSVSPQYGNTNPRRRRRRRKRRKGRRESSRKQGKHEMGSISVDKNSLEAQLNVGDAPQTI
jgi:hypothetical protein